MMWFYVLCTLMMGFFLLKNIHSFGEYKTYSRQAVFTFEDTRTFHKVSRILFTAGFIGAVILLAVSLFVWRTQYPATIISIVCLIVGCALFAFFPFTPGRWVLTDKGIYIYNNNVFLSWPQMISAQIVARGKKSFIVITLKQRDGESLKRTVYPVLVPNDKALDICHMIKDFINMIDKKRLHKHLNEERSASLKERKFY